MDGETFLLPLYTARIAPHHRTRHRHHLQRQRHLPRPHPRSPPHHPHPLLRRQRTPPPAPSTSPQPKAPSPAPTPNSTPTTSATTKASPAFNFPYRLLAHATWQPNFETSNRPLSAFANGWDHLPHLPPPQRSSLTRSPSPVGPYLSGGSESLNGSGGALYLPTVGRNTLRLPPATTIDLRLARTLTFHETIRLHAIAEAYNLANHVNLSGVTQRAYLVGDPVSGITPLVFQNAANIAAEGVNTRPFGTYTDSGTSETRARALLFGLRLEF